METTVIETPIIPAEIWVYILSYCPEESLKLPLVCKWWNQILDSLYYENISHTLFSRIGNDIVSGKKIPGHLISNFNLDEARLAKSWKWLVRFFIKCDHWSESFMVVRGYKDNSGLWTLLTSNKEISFREQTTSGGKMMKYTVTQTDIYLGQIRYVRGSTPLSGGYGVSTSLISGVKYLGQWSGGERSGPGEILYPDGVTKGCQFAENIPMSDIRHPKVMEAMEHERCTILGGYPQRMFYGGCYWYCEHCAYHCIPKEEKAGKFCRWVMNPEPCHCHCSK